MARAVGAESDSDEKLADVRCARVVLDVRESGLAFGLLGKGACELACARPRNLRHARRAYQVALGWREERARPRDTHARSRLLAACKAQLTLALDMRVCAFSVLVVHNCSTRRQQPSASAQCKCM